jgi:outer membrane murein-binding lipoprotein Lpp
MMAAGRAAPWLIGSLALVLSGAALQGQDARPQYRAFVLGTDLSSVAVQVGQQPSDAAAVHVRPALIQTLTWRQPYFAAGSNAPQADPVGQIVFSFYNDQLFRLVIDYDRQRTEGMTDADMIDALSEKYGATMKPKPKPRVRFQTEFDVESGEPIAAWGTAEYSLVLSHLTFAGGFQVVVTSTALDALARSASAAAVRLDQLEAPQRAIAQQKQAEEDTRTSQEKARMTNKAAFRP